MRTCQKCEAAVSGNYCAQCGQALVPPRISHAFIVDELRSVFNFEKGIFFTIKALLTKPGFYVKQYIHKDRSRLVKPILFLIICSLIYSVLLQIMNADATQQFNLEEDKNLTHKMFEWVIINSGYANIIMSFYIGLLLKFFFRKQDYNFFEILILLSFVMGIGMLIFTFFLILRPLGGNILDVVASFVSFFYSAWAIGTFFEGKRLVNFFKALFAYIFGAILFYISIFILGQSISAML